MNYESYINLLWQNYATSITVFVSVFVGFAVFQRILLWRLRSLALKTQTDIDDAVIKIISAINPPFYFFLSLFIATRFAHLSQQYERWLMFAVIAIVVFQVVTAVNVFIDYLTQKFSRQTENEHSNSAIDTLGRIGKIAVWILGVLVILQNLGVEVTSLVAGLGIGGVAIALAAQNILGDLFASFSIIFDKPFKVGDFIQIGNNLGEVKRIGIKTTRLKSLQGEELIIGNTDLTSNRIQNYGVMSSRRIVFKVGIIYETPKTKITKAKTIMRKAINDQENAKLDRVHLKEFGDSALNFECVYFVTSSDYNVYMDTQEDINMAIISGFEREAIEFAYPTQMTYNKNI